MPYYLAIGMNLDEYWWGDNDLPRIYRKSKELKDREQNKWIWLQGMYIYEAISDLAPILRFSTKPTKAERYPDCPYPLTEAERKEQDEAKAKQKYERIMQYMKARVNDGRN